MRPVLLELGPFHLYGYGLMLFLGGLSGLGWLRTRRAAMGFKSDDDFWHLANALMFGMMIGSRVLYVFLYTPPFTREFWTAFVSLHSNFAVQGGLALGSLNVWLLCRWRRVDAARVFDHVAVSTAIWQAFGRVGCFLAGCCYGRPCSLPWAVTFRDPRAPVPSEWLGTPLHPTQLYEAAGNALIAAGLYQLLKRTEGVRPAGLVAAAYFFAYGFQRFALEFVRGDTVPLGAFGLTSCQGASLAMVGVGAATLAWRRWCSRPS